MVIGTNIFINSTGNFQRFNTSYESSAIAFDDGTIGFSTNTTAANATRRMTITSGGNVGIGTTSPSASDWNASATLLHIYQNSTNGSILKLESSNAAGVVAVGNNQMQIATTTDDPMIFYTNSAERMRISSTGVITMSGSDATYIQQNYSGTSKSFFGTAGSGTDIISGAAAGDTTIRAQQKMLFATGGDVERMRLTSVGALKLAVNGASVRSQTDNVPEISQADNLHCLVLSQKNASFTQNGFGAFGMAVDKAAGTDWTFAGWYSGTTSDREYQFRGDGQAYADTGWTTPASDYAEYFESVDGTALPFGSTVSLINNKIKIAEEGETVIGVIRPKDAQLFLGNNASQKWNQKYLKNEYGSYIRDAEGHKVLNPEYNPEVEYIPREKRNEWNVVGLVGQIPVTKGQITNPNWVKMRDISDTVEEWLVK